MITRVETTADTPLVLLTGVIVGAAVALIVVCLVRPRSVRDVALSVPLDDEPTTPGDLEAIAVARAAVAQGDVTPWPELKRRRRAAKTARQVAI